MSRIRRARSAEVGNTGFAVYDISQVAAGRWLTADNATISDIHYTVLAIWEIPRRRPRANLPLISSETEDPPSATRKAIPSNFWVLRVLDNF